MSVRADEDMKSPLRIESTTLRTLAVHGHAFRKMCVCAPLVALETSTMHLDPTSRFDAALEELTVFEALFESFGVIDFDAFVHLRIVRFHVSCFHAVPLLAAMHACGSPSIRHIEVNISSTWHFHSWEPRMVPPKMTHRFVRLFENHPALETLHIIFEATPRWITDFMCSIAASSLKELRVENSRPAEYYHGAIHARRLRDYLASRPGLRVYTKNIIHE